MTSGIEPESESKSIGPSHTWSCPYDGCKKYIACWSATGLNYLREEHVSKHRQQEKADSTLVAALARLRERNPNKLPVSLTDIGFLKTRGIKLDDDIELDFSVDDKPSKTELSQKTWAKILETVCLSR